MMLSAVLALLCAAAVAGVTPRPEYPRPQFVRDDWQNLNGAWTCELDLDAADEPGKPDAAKP
jgi:hypothetical protein